MGIVIAAIFSFISFFLSIPLIGYIISPALRRSQVRRFKVGAVSDLMPEHPVEMETVIDIQDGWMKAKATRAFWAIKKETGVLRVFNPHCTHLGCAYCWDGQDRLFKCPCHAGVYDIDGNVISGPPPRPLDLPEYHIDDQELFVHYQDFVAGSPKKIPL